MPEWLTQGALPFGFLMFLGTLVTFARRRAGHRKASRRYPELAARLGLSYKPPRYRGAVGLVRGDYRGFTVYVDPDDQRAIVVRFTREPRVDLRSYDHFSGAPYGLHHYRSGAKRFDALFRTRYVADEIASALDQAGELDALADAFRGRYYRQLKGLSITSTGVKAVFDFGSPPFIPPEAVEELLPAMVDLALLIEPIEQTDETTPGSQEP